MKKTFKSLLLTAVAMVLTLSAYAQVTTSAISGKVSDAQGAVVGAAVIATHTPSGTQYFSVTDKDGQYRINSIVPGGPYTIKIEMLGYSSLTITDVIAPLAETIIADATIKEEAIGLEAAVVSADSNESGMNIRRSGASTTISERTKETMPSVSRSMNDLMALTPQSSSTTSGFAVGGGNYRGSAVTVDGAAFSNMFGIGQNLPAGGTPISLDALEQISINITPFDVRQSGFQGGAINAVTKSGTNQWKASVYDYYTSGKLRGYKAADKEITYAEALNNTIGFTLGGPIIKNKLFFFVNAEYTADNVPGSTTSARPDASTPWASGDKQYNRPVAGDLDAMKSFLAEKFNGYNPGRYQGYSLSTPDYKILARIDWNINNNNKLNVRFSHTHVSGSNSPSSSMSPLGGTDSKFGSYAWNRYSAGRQSEYAMPFESSRYFQEQNFTSVAAELNTRVADGKGNNMVRVAWSHQYEPRSFVGSLFPTVDIMSDYAVTTGTDNLANYTTFGVDPFTYGNLRDCSAITVTDEFTYTIGKNNIIAGLQYEFNSTKNGYMQGGAGWFVYDSWETFKKDVESPDESSYPIGFMITHANLDNPATQVFPTFNYNQFSAYVQDEVSFSDNFKVTAGLRFEVPMITIPTDNFNKDFDAIQKANPTSSFAGLSTADVPKARLTVSPRIGFNWDVLGNRNLIVRGGSGLFAGRIPNVWLVSAIGNGNCLQYQYIANDKTGSNKIHFSADRDEIIDRVWNGSFTKQDLAAPTAGTIMDKNLKLPSSWKSSLAIDAKLPGGIKATIEGVYSQNFNEVYAMPLGYKQTAVTSLPGESGARQIWKSEGIKNNDTKPANVNGYYVTNVDLNGSYHSLSAQLSKDFRFGLNLMAAYTYSVAKSVSDGNGDQVSEFANTYSRNTSCVPELGYANYVAPHRVIGNIGWTINEGRVTATKLGVFYEGFNLGYISSYSYSRVSYLMNSTDGISASQDSKTLEWSAAGNGTGSSLMMFIPTDAQLEKMPFSSDENKQAFKDFISSDKYCKNHRGEYMQRNGAVAPWYNRITAHVAQDFYFNIAGRKQTLEIGCDINNVANLLNKNWGTVKQMSSNTVLTYAPDKTTGTDWKYTFKAPVWDTYKSTASTWQILFSAKWYF